MLLNVSSADSDQMRDRYQSITELRVPAEWEPQEAIWIQWPNKFEKIHEPAFADISSVVIRYQKLHIVCDSQHIVQQARNAISKAGTDPDHPNIVWHVMPNDSAWMRDNGPVYVIADGQYRVQNWRFNAWGGAFGSQVPYLLDDQIPQRVAEYLRLPVDRTDIVHERGNLEFNGVDAVIANWSVIGDPDRNRDYAKDQAKEDFKRYFGVSKVILIEGVPQGDLTKGHVDGIARFIDQDTVVVPECTASSNCRPGDGKDDAVYDEAAQVIQAAGFNVIRDPIDNAVQYGGRLFDTNYTNWLVGNGFVIVVGFGDDKSDASAKSRIESYFPGRDVYVIEMLRSWAAGGGVHCHTNDQPALSLATSVKPQYLQSQ